MTPSYTANLNYCRNIPQDTKTKLQDFADKLANDHFLAVSAQQAVRPCSFGG